MAKLKSRPQRWALAAETAQTAIEELMEIQEEYQEWRDTIPENLEQSPVAEKLDEVIELDLDFAHSTICDADGLDLPLGFGRD